MPADAPHSDVLDVPTSDRLDLLVAMLFREDLLPFVRQIGNADDPRAEFERLLRVPDKRRRFMELLEGQYPRESLALEVVLNF